MAWSRNYSRRNTRLLRSLIRSGRIVVDCENGIVLRPNGEPYATTPNFWGYTRFRIRIKRRGKTINAWFFLHKAVWLAGGGKLNRPNHELNHIDHNRANARRNNLEYIHRKLNKAHKVAEEVEGAF